MYKMKIKEKVFECPKESLYGFALLQAMGKGIMSGNIHDEKTAKEFLENNGVIFLEEV